MNDRNAYPNGAGVTHGENRGALFACGMWLRLGFVGASAAMAGVVALFSGEGTPLSALALAAGGAALTVLGWRRAYAAIDAPEPRKHDAAAASAPIRSPAGA
jgi:hypothetical protein